MLDQDSNGVPIRAVSRAIAVLQAINRAGSANMTTIAQLSGVPYPTACRLVETLIHEGMVERETGRKYYRPAALVQTLSHGFQGFSRLVSGARPHLEALTREILWPVSFVTRVGHAMVVRDSTHSLTSLTFNHYHPGFSLPILTCASGLVYLSFAPAEERQILIDGLKLADGIDREALVMFENDYLPQKIRSDGFAIHVRNPHTLNPGKTSSISVPLFDGETLAGTLTLVFFSTAMKPGDAARQFYAQLNRTARAIEDSWGRTPVAANG